MKIHVVDNSHYLGPQKKGWLKKQVKLALKSLNLPNSTEICIAFVDDRAMRKLNENYRGIKKTTDVLSFSQHGLNSEDLSAAIAKHNKNKYRASRYKASSKNLTLGDIAISIDTARRHAKLYGNSLKKEIQKLVVHGILHLIGYDHKKRSDTTRMRKKEKELLALIRSL